MDKRDSFEGIGGQNLRLWLELPLQVYKEPRFRRPLLSYADIDLLSFPFDQSSRRPAMLAPSHRGIPGRLRLRDGKVVHRTITLEEMRDFGAGCRAPAVSPALPDWGLEPVKGPCLVLVIE
jgi:hypothetical protein